MKVAVVVPSYRRHLKLARCIDSALGGSYPIFDIYVYADAGDQATKQFLLNRYGSSVQCVVNEEREYVIGSWNHFAANHSSAYDCMAWIVDDTELYPDCLEMATRAMERHFPDTDGVIGMRQECPGYPNYTYKKYGQCILGRKFICRYEPVDYQICCPEYSHFYQDEELHRFAESMGRFYFCETATVKHFHPSFAKDEMDATHSIVRGDIMRRDTHVYRARKAQGLCWGKTWNLLDGSHDKDVIG